MHDQDAFKAQVDDVLSEFVRRETAQLTGIDPELAPIAQQLRTTMMSGGKRLRAAFCYLGWRSAGQPESDAAVRAAAAIEFAHAAALVHDDIIDASTTRRGEPSAHVALRAAIADPSWQHAGALGLAILIGDLLLAWAGQLFTSCGLPRAFIARAVPSWSLLARELVAGECLEILHTGNGHSHERALEIIRFKTAKYTVERPLHIGARLGGASPHVLSAFSSYGVPMGEAFQLRDDLLALFGDAERTGKSGLSDFIGNKPTPLIAVALSLAGPTDRAQLQARLGRSDLDDSDLRQIRELVERVGARARVESMIQDRAASALSALREAQLPPLVSQGLTSLASTVVTREY